MSSILTGFAVIMMEAGVAFYKRIHAINFGVYGATMVGKTTLHHQLRTRGEVPEIKQRTVGVGRATRKSIKIDGNSNTLKTADIGGEAIYWKEWLLDRRIVAYWNIKSKEEEQRKRMKESLKAFQSDFQTKRVPQVYDATPQDGISSDFLAKLQ